MKSICPQCEGILELEYYVKAKKNLKVVQITFNVKCRNCGAVVPMMITPEPIRDKEKEMKAIAEKDNANYIG